MRHMGPMLLSIVMIAATLLLVFGVRLTRHPETRRRGVLMIVCAAVFVGNVMIWTL